MRFTWFTCHVLLNWSLVILSSENVSHFFFLHQVFSDCKLRKWVIRALEIFLYSDICLWGADDLSATCPRFLQWGWLFSDSDWLDFSELCSESDSFISSAVSIKRDSIYFIVNLNCNWLLVSMLTVIFSPLLSSPPALHMSSTYFSQSSHDLASMTQKRFFYPSDSL